ncbi:MAG: RDD family protein [Chitinophagaceae bacterium]|nr:RDD family protein [Chitinophagaceae bacterium]
MPDSVNTIGFPSLKERVQSTFIDTLLIISLMFVAAAALDRFGPVPDWLRIVIFLTLWLVYEPLATSLGSTLGNYLMKIRVREYGKPNQRINFLLALVRYVIKFLLGWLSFITISTNPEKRAIHDLAAGSIMIKIPAWGSK